MSAPITITGTVSVWLASYQKPHDLMHCVEHGNQQRAVEMLTYFGSVERDSFSDSIRIGEADVTVRLLPRDEQTIAAVRALQAKLNKLRAAYLTAQQELLEQISKYQAITNEVEEA